MTPGQIVSAVLGRGARLEVEGDGLRLRGVKRLPADLLSEVRARAVELHALLRDGEVAPDAEAATDSGPEPPQAPAGATTATDGPPDPPTPTASPAVDPVAVMFQRELDHWRAAHGVADAVSTGPASPAELEAARAELGHPTDHEEWLAACERWRREHPAPEQPPEPPDHPAWPAPPGSGDPDHPSWIAAGRPAPGSLAWRDWRHGLAAQVEPDAPPPMAWETFKAELTAAVARLSVCGRYPSGRPAPEGQAADLELDEAARQLHADPARLPEALAVLRRWERVWQGIGVQ